MTSTFSPGQVRLNCATASAASTTCSKLSSRSNSWRLSRWAAIVSTSGLPPCSFTAKA